MPEPGLRIITDLPHVVLQPLTAEHAASYVALVQRNVAHLRQHGDYADEVKISEEQTQAGFAANLGLAFAILLKGDLVGRVDLVAVDPPKYGLGYWLAEDATGRGLASTAVRALPSHAARELGATDVFAGVTHGNRKSQALLERCGFRAVECFEAYTRFHLAM